jgi:membrane-associated phospholipid phosphatase
MEGHASPSSSPESTMSNTQDPVSFRRTWKIILVSFPIVVLFITISFYKFDLPIAKYFRLLYLDGETRQILKGISKFGWGTPYIVCSLVLFCFFKFVYKKPLWSNRALFVFLSVSLSGIFVSALKFAFGRYRPKMMFKEQLYGFAFFELKGKLTSFPSGHAATIVALMVSLYFMHPKYKVVYFVIAFIIIATRLILYQHYLADVVFSSYLAVVLTLCVKHYLDRRGLAV